MILNWLALYLCIMTNASVSDAVNYMETGKKSKRIMRIRNLLKEECTHKSLSSNEGNDNSGVFYRYACYENKINYEKEDIADEPSKVAIAIPS